jgi:outer membrane protein assembly factor BamD (BamD/ComL family)
LAHLFLEQHRAQPQNPDLLALANINRKKFSEAFPNDSRIEKLEDALVQMKEVYAEELYSTGQLYERKKEPTASVLYYSNTILQYPNTDAARLSKERLKELEDYAIKLDLPKELWQ